MSNELATLEQLLGIMRRLRDPQDGCAWDVKQDFHSIAPFTIEEAYEVADAIERNDLDDLCDELGDLLFQVVFHAQMASEIGAFTFDDVTQGIIDKMLRRHPHVFADVVYRDEQELKAGWEAIKAEERRLKAQRRQQRFDAAGVDHDAVESADAGERESPASVLDGIPRSLPALKRADKLQRRAARIGFDWPRIEPIWDKLEEETLELRQALAAEESDAIEDELGDLLFTVVNLARHCGVDAEQALQRASGKFDRRFRQVEQLAEQETDALQDMTLQQLDELWNRAKQRG